MLVIDPIDDGTGAFLVVGTCRDYTRPGRSVRVFKGPAMPPAVAFRPDDMTPGAMVVQFEDYEFSVLSHASLPPQMVVRLRPGQNPVWLQDFQPAGAENAWWPDVASAGSGSDKIDQMVALALNAFPDHVRALCATRGARGYEDFLLAAYDAAAQRGAGGVYEFVHNWVLPAQAGPLGLQRDRDAQVRQGLQSMQLAAGLDRIRDMEQRMVDVVLSARRYL